VKRRGFGSTDDEVLERFWIEIEDGRVLVAEGLLFAAGDR